MTDPDVRAVQDYFDSRCNGHHDCPIPHEAFERIVSRLAKPAPQPEQGERERFEKYCFLRYGQITWSPAITAIAWEMWQAALRGNQ